MTIEAMAIEAAAAEALRGFEGPILVTGAGGWLGRATLGMLLDWLGRDRFARQVTAYASQARSQAIAGPVEIACLPLSALADARHAEGGIICHYAFLTKDKVADWGAERYTAENGEISRIVLGAVERLRPRGVFLTSSGAADGAQADEAGRLYGRLKAKDEADFADAARRLGHRAVIARLYNIAGPWINKPEAYVLAAILTDVLAGRPVALKAKAPVLRSYTHVGDAIGLSLLALLSPAPLPAVIPFDTEGETLVEVGDLAERIRRLLGREDLAIERSWDPAAAANLYRGDGAAMRALAARLGVGLRGLDEQILDTARFLKG